MLVIKVNQPRAVFLPPASSKVEDERNGLRLLPGENAVSEEYFEAIASNPGVRILLESGVIENKGAGKARSLADGLDALSIDDARRVVAKISSIEVLNKLKANTSKKAALTALNERLKELSTEAK